MQTVGDRIKAMRKERDKMSRKRLAELTGIGYSSIAELERGGQQTTTKLHLYAKALGVHESWLATGKGPKYATNAIDEDRWSNVLGYAQDAGLSEGAEAQDYVETHWLKFRRESLEEKNLVGRQLAVMYGKGDSMLKRIRSGDAILYDKGDTNPQHDSLFVIQLHGVAGADLLSVKRCEVLGDIVTFRADNPKAGHGWHSPRRMDDRKSPIKILGRVRWIGSWED